MKCSKANIRHSQCLTSLFAKFKLFKLGIRSNIPSNPFNVWILLSLKFSCSKHGKFSQITSLNEIGAFVKTQEISFKSLSSRIRDKSTDLIRLLIANFICLCFIAFASGSLLRTSIHKLRPFGIEIFDFMFPSILAILKLSI